MDFRRLSKLSSAQVPINGSESLGLTEIPPNILDTLVPGYSLISKYILAAYGVDVSIFVSAAVILLAGYKGGQYLYNKLFRAFRYLFVSSVYIDEHDDLFDMLMDWLATNHETSSRRSVRARTQRGNRVGDTFDSSVDDALDSEGMFDYNRWSARVPPRYEPYYGRHFLWHSSRLFVFHRSQRSTVNQNVNIRFGNNNDDDVIQLDCIGRSVEPIRELLRTVKVWSLQRQRNTTTIRHPTPKDRARFAGAWSKTFSRPSRPMDTVILDSEQKDMIINDMNEYLHPLSPKWYATRGIPYRRGYLFHGPPGTGKTSLSFALAGIFGLEIYIVSLQEPTLTEGDLMQLFNGLPKRCIVLLEDVDAAGLLREGPSRPDDGNARGRWRKAKTARDNVDGPGKQETTDANDGKPKAQDEYTLKDLARELKSINAPKSGGDKPQDNPNRQPGTGISLSGLLNAIDGVASHEGRVLIMTTNHPEKLDAALVRPGRVDRRVQFSMAGNEQVRELFYRMYVSVDDGASPKLSLEHLTNGNLDGHLPEKEMNGHIDPITKQEDPSDLPTRDLRALAIRFAERVPDDTFTPAEIQNHLMRYKKEPRAAVERVPEWVKETLAEKAEHRDLTEEVGDGVEDDRDSN